MSEILEMRDCLLRLLDRVAQKQPQQAELMRARREFFGAEQPPYAEDEQALELAAIRFAEWFLLERCNEHLGEIPVLITLEEERLREEPQEALDRLDCMATSRVGVFICEANDGDRAQVRDLQGGERLELASLPVVPDPGDILVSRLYEHGGGAWLPSVAMAILPATPELAVAYQKDLRQLGLDRRLTQSELEHLLFRRWARSREQAQVPLEHLEAELERVLASAGLAQTYPVAEISAALHGVEQPGAVIGPILDQLAFDSDIDLDVLRRLMNEIWSCRATTPERPEKTTAKDTAKPSATAKKPASRPEPGNGNPLGMRVAERLDAGIAKHENLDGLFQELAGMIGEGSLDEDGDAEISAPEGGDLEPLLLEFVWEEGLDAEQETTLMRFLRNQLDAPVPKNEIECLERDDLMRFLLGSWLDSAPSTRVAIVQDHAELLRRFFVWVQATQSMDVAELATVHENPLLTDAERLNAASRALSTSERPEAEAGEPLQLMRITGVGNERLSLLLDAPQREVAAVIPQRASNYLREDDLMFARFADGGGRGRILGMVVVVPGELHHLLG